MSVIPIIPHYVNFATNLPQKRVGVPPPPPLQCLFKNGGALLNQYGGIIPRVQTWSRLPGDSLERSYLFYDRPSTLSSNAPTFRGQSRLSGFCCANGLCVRSLLPPQFAHAHIWWKQLRDINYEPKVALSSPDPNKFGGITGRSPGERPHYGIAGDSPACRGKSRQKGPDVIAGIIATTNQTSWCAPDLGHHYVLSFICTASKTVEAVCSTCLIAEHQLHADSHFIPSSFGKDT